jgi:hypothetical protein
MSTGTNVVVIDNVIRRLDSDSLCMAITAATIADRVTSKNSNRRQPRPQNEAVRFRSALAARG